MLLPRFYHSILKINDEFIYSIGGHDNSQTISNW